VIRYFVNTKGVHADHWFPMSEASGRQMTTALVSWVRQGRLPQAKVKCFVALACELLPARFEL